MPGCFPMKISSSALVLYHLNWATCCVHAWLTPLMLLWPMLRSSAMLVYSSSYLSSDPWRESPSSLLLMHCSGALSTLCLSVPPLWTHASPQSCNPCTWYSHLTQTPFTRLLSPSWIFALTTLGSWHLALSCTSLGLPYRCPCHSGQAIPHANLPSKGCTSTWCRLQIFQALSLSHNPGNIITLSLTDSF
jgi:hypothetical protein